MLLDGKISSVCSRVCVKRAELTALKVRIFRPQGALNSIYVY